MWVFTVGCALENESRSGADPVEEIVASCLADPLGDSESAFERAIAQNPHFAERLREQFELLRDAGLLHNPEDDDIEGFPERLGEFHLKKRLGGGGMGVVYLAVQQSLDGVLARRDVREVGLRIAEHRRVDRGLFAGRQVTNIDSEDLLRLSVVADLKARLVPLAPRDHQQDAPGQGLGVYSGRKRNRELESGVSRALGRVAGGTKAQAKERGGGGDLHESCAM